MSDIAKITEQSAARVESARLAVEAIARQVSDHDRDMAAKRVQFEQLDADNRAYRTALALKEKPTVQQPSVTELENLRLDLELSGNTTMVLQGRKTAAAIALVAAKRAHLDGCRDHLMETVLSPASAELEAAFLHLRDVAAKQMAAHYVVHRKLNERAPIAENLQDLYGPMAEFLHAIYVMRWAEYPYNIRPSWLPMQGRFWVDELPGVHERVNELLSGVQGALS